MANQQLTNGSLLQNGKYRIEDTLGHGSFGITYLATHTGLNHKVCVKEFFMQGMNTRAVDGSIAGMSDGSLPYNYARKFRTEAENLAHIEHPNIVRVTDFFEENGTVYYVMDFIEGENLNDYIKNHPLSFDEAKNIIKNVAAALQYMHEEKHMLHLDLKPGNIMRRSSDGHVFLIDFGLSKHYNESGQPDTSTTIGLGTPGYAPSEQGNASKNGAFRPAIDVYALGGTYFKLLTGETPPHASDVIDDEDIIINKLREKNVPEDVVTLINNAMQPSAKKRTPDMKAFIAQLDATVAVPPVKEEKKKPETKVDEEKTEIGNNDDKTRLIPEVPPVSGLMDSPEEDDEEEKEQQKKKNTLIIVFSALATIAVAVLIILFANGTFKSGPTDIDDDDDDDEEETTEVCDSDSVAVGYDDYVDEIPADSSYDYYDDNNDYYYDDYAADSCAVAY